MKNIFLMTIFQVPNYGSVLQAFATQHVVERLGYKCSVINYKYPNAWNYKKGIERSSLPRRMVRFLKSKIAFFHDRYFYLEKFRKKYLNLTKLFKDYDALKRYNWKDEDILVAGSDQIWNFRFLKGDKAFMLLFAENCKKISIASSFASDKLPAEAITVYKDSLSKFSAISVRETNGQEIIEKQLKLDVKPKVLLDPTLLLSGNEWIEILNLKSSSRKPYVLLYIQAYAFDPKPYIYDVAKHIAMEMGCDDIISIMDIDYGNLERIGAQSANSFTTEQFVELIKNASAVVTSSFHGTAFAVNFGVPLISVTPHGKDDRQLSLLSSLGASEQAVKVGTPFAQISPFYDTEKVRQNLSAIREDNINWIKQSLDD